MPSRMTVHKWFLRMQYELSLCLVSGGEGLDKELTTPQVSRPGLTLAGYFRHFDARQMQVLGQQEIAYVSDLAPARRGEIFRQMLDRHASILDAAGRFGISPHTHQQPEAGFAQIPDVFLLGRIVGPQ